MWMIWDNKKLEMEDLYQVISTDQPDQWRKNLPAEKSVFGSVEYASIVEKYVGHKARLFEFLKNDINIIYPFFLRTTTSFPFLINMKVNSFDTLSPEYTGPLSFKPATVEQKNEFQNCFSEYCRQEGIITEFAHLHPWNCPKDSLINDGARYDREIIYVDLQLSEEEIWKNSLNRACRKNINRSKRENVRLFIAQTLTDIEEFHQIYTMTMDRNQAHEKYYFSLDYFIEFFQTMPDNARFVLAEYEGQIVAATLYLHDGEDVYSYLGGADHEFQNVRPTNAIVYDTIVWAKEQGKKRLILGGGYKPDDGIFRFKASFSPLRAEFFTYRQIHMPELYTCLSMAWEKYYQCDLEDDGYFPAYRAIPEAEPQVVNSSH